MGKFFESELVREELEEIGKLQQEIYGNVISFPSMSRQEQLEHVDKLTEFRRYCSHGICHSHKYVSMVITP